MNYIVTHSALNFRVAATVLITVDVNDVVLERIVKDYKKEVVLSKNRVQKIINFSTNNVEDDVEVNVF